MVPTRPQMTTPSGVDWAAAKDAEDNSLNPGRQALPSVRMGLRAGSNEAGASVAMLPQTRNLTVPSGGMGVCPDSTSPAAKCSSNMASAKAFATRGSGTGAALESQALSSNEHWADRCALFTAPDPRWKGYPSCHKPCAGKRPRSAKWREWMTW